MGDEEECEEEGEDQGPMGGPDTWGDQHPGEPEEGFEHVQDDFNVPIGTEDEEGEEEADRFDAGLGVPSQGRMKSAGSTKEADQFGIAEMQSQAQDVAHESPAGRGGYVTPLDSLPSTRDSKSKSLGAPSQSGMKSAGSTKEADQFGIAEMQSQAQDVAHESLGGRGRGRGRGGYVTPLDSLPSTRDSKPKAPGAASQQNVAGSMTQSAKGSRGQRPAPSKGSQPIAGQEHPAMQGYHMKHEEGYARHEEAGYQMGMATEGQQGPGTYKKAEMEAAQNQIGYKQDNGLEDHEEEGERSQVFHQQAYGIAQQQNTGDGQLIQTIMNDQAGPEGSLVDQSEEGEDVPEEQQGIDNLPGQMPSKTGSKTGSKPSGPRRPSYEVGYPFPGKQQPEDGAEDRLSKSMSIPSREDEQEGETPIAQDQFEQGPGEPYQYGKVDQNVQNGESLQRMEDDRNFSRGIVSTGKDSKPPSGMGSQSQSRSAQSNKRSSIVNGVLQKMPPGEKDSPRKTASGSKRPTFGGSTAGTGPERRTSVDEIREARLDSLARKGITGQTKKPSRPMSQPNDFESPSAEVSPGDIAASSKSSNAFSAQGESKAAAKATSIKRGSSLPSDQQKPSLFSNQRLSEVSHRNILPRTSLISSAVPYNQGRQSQPSRPSQRTSKKRTPSGGSIDRISEEPLRSKRPTGGSRGPQSLPKGSQGPPRQSQGARGQSSKQSNQCSAIQGNECHNAKDRYYEQERRMITTCCPCQPFKMGEAMSQAQKGMKPSTPDDRPGDTPDAGSFDGEPGHAGASTKFDLSGIVDITFHVSKEQQEKILKKLKQKTSSNVHLKVPPEMEIQVSDVKEERTQEGASLQCSLKGEVDVDFILDGLESDQPSEEIEEIPEELGQQDVFEEPGTPGYDVPQNEGPQGEIEAVEDVTGEPEEAGEDETIGSAAFFQEKPDPEKEQDAIEQVNFDHVLPEVERPSKLEDFDLDEYMGEAEYEYVTVIEGSVALAKKNRFLRFSTDTFSNFTSKIMLRKFDSAAFLKHI